MTVRIPFKAGDYIRIWLRDSGVCGICSEPVDPAEISIDHIHPISRGGSHELENWQLAHKRCNSSKGAGPREKPTAPTLTKPSTRGTFPRKASRRSLRQHQSGGDIIDRINREMREEIHAAVPPGGDYVAWISQRLDMRPGAVRAAIRRRAAAMPTEQNG